MIRLYGILQYLGECKETENVSDRFPIAISTKTLNKYKKIKPLNSNSGIQVLRGFADAKTLASISKTNNEFQRPINKEHKRDIKEYLIKSKEDKIYFPEVTLLYKYNPEIDLNNLAFRPLWEMKDVNQKNVFMLSIIDALGVAYLDLKDNEKLYRLDGNHRLEALSEIGNNRNLSFCIILVPKTSKFSYEHLYFYLLNSTGLPIDTIKTLDIVTKADEGELKEFIESDALLNLLNKTKESWKDFKDKEKEILMKVAKELLKNNSKNKILENIIKESIGIYKGMKNCSCSILGFICFLRLKCKDTDGTKENLKHFQNRAF
ncbi:hypothetical protein B6S12_01380 [Helicobacter valdiviensis]|uniref:DGQHR domain-containing protein n=1 Tax=Helicobacter valdiviensis TaxID=1458358 RepID=A0A2W6MWT6_9HELI|nr:DNA sulfur modification protein DndB [Helicobacter valdiviensis]PZT48974.1 hypothetical protein B6S12_01380 [Helicobacter valdiviensis]